MSAYSSDKVEKYSIEEIKKIIEKSELLELKQEITPSID